MSVKQKSNLIPSWLEIPPKTIVNPPVKTRIQELPFEDLTWEDFERLCLRLVRLERVVEHCQLYGTRGQDQGGIDLYARRFDEKYFVYQCKRVKNFGPPSIKTAVEKFLEGNWVDKTDTFILCTSESMVPTERANEIEIQKEVLNKNKIKFISWDKETLSSKLKQLPELVDDFFGRAWVEQFCGVEKAKKLNSRLDSQLVLEFREQMKVFYKRVFQTHDPGLPTANQMNMSSISLENRFVLPDIIDKRTFQIVSDFENTEQDHSENLTSTHESSSNDTRRTTTRSNTTYHQRQDLESWLSNNNGRNIILGRPGSGKSSLLRFIALDLLSDSPKLSLISKKWGCYLPIWLPFALWTKYIAESQAGICSIKEVLKGWLKSWDEERLWPLVEQALEDKRLILLVDGLDEWTNEQSARIALDRLTVFVQQRDVPVILTSRPHGFERVGMGAGEWEIGELSDFSNAQQKQLLNIWFTLWYKNTINSQQDVDDEVTQRTKHAIDDFNSQLQRSSDLRELAKVPLLLSLLILLKINDARLPQNRFKAYEKLIELFISTHPQRRVAAAGVQANELDLNDDEIKMVMSFLAFTIHEKHNEGVITLNDAILQLELYLRDEEIGLGLGRKEAIKISRLILNIGEGNLGLLVSKSPTEIGFFHRAFQEFLASFFLYTNNKQKQLQIISENCSNPQWHEVILGLIHINNRPEDIKEYTQIIREKIDSNTENFNINLLIYEATFGPYNMPVSLARQYCEEAFNEIETGHWMPYRERVLKLVIDGLKSSRLKEIIKNKIVEWFPDRQKWRDGIIDAISEWDDKDNQLSRYFIRGLFDEEYQNKKSAVKALVKKYNGDKEIGNYLVNVVKEPRDSITKALVIDGLVSGWSEHSEINIILEYAKKSASPELKLSAIKANVLSNTHGEEDLTELIRLGSRNSGINYRFIDDIEDLLLKGWFKDEKLKSACLSSLIIENEREESLDKKTSLKVLLKAFSDDKDVINYCVKEISENPYPFLLLHSNAWKIIKEKYQDNKLIINAIDTWLLKKQHDEPDVAYAALVGCTEIAKKVLLERVKSSNYPHWAAWALLEGWGMQDGDVAATLKEIVNGDFLIASKLGHLIPIIIKDEQTAKNKIMQLVKSKGNIRLDFLLSGVEETWDNSIKNSIKEHLLKTFVEQEDDSDNMLSNWMIAVNFLIYHYPNDLRIKELALQELQKRKGLFEVIARSYEQDDYIRGYLLKIAFPLPAQLRQVIAYHLGEGMEQEEFNISLLKLYDYDVDSLVKTQSSISYHKHIIYNETRSLQAIEDLSKTIVYYGIDYADRRQASFCGLVTLKKLEVFLKAEERIGEDKTSYIPLTTGLTKNITFFEHLLDNWDYIKGCIGDDISTRFRFSRSDKDPLYFWDELSLLINEDYPNPKSELTKFLEDRKERTITPNLLKILSKERPKSPLLLEYLLESLSINQQSGKYNEYNLIYTSAKILGEQFRNDNRVLQLVSNSIYESKINESKINESALIAMCEGWPNDEKLKIILNHIKENKIGLNYMTYFQLVSRTSSTDDFIEIIIDHINDSRDKLFLWRREEVNGPILRRIKDDDELSIKLLERLRNKPTLIEKANITKLIATSRGVSSELREWINEQINDEWKEAICQDAEDLLLGEVRPLVHILLEL